MENKWVGIVNIVILSLFNIAMAYEEEGLDNLDEDGQGSQLEVRAVFINCEPQVLNIAPDNDITRFERNELFRHSILKECIRKLALTVKITSDTGNSGVEYLPIEHVFEGTNEKRVRLLNPYVLRLRRDMPRQAYKLRRIDTVRGVLTNADILTSEDKRFGALKHRNHRDVYEVSDNTEPNSKVPLRSYSEASHVHGTSQFLYTSVATPMIVADGFVNYESHHVCPAFNNTINTRRRRNEHNVVVEAVTDVNTERIPDDSFYRGTEQDRKKLEDMIRDYNKHNTKKESVNNKHTIQKNASKKEKVVVGPHSNIKIKTEDSELLGNHDALGIASTNDQAEDSVATDTYSEEDRNEVSAKAPKAHNAKKDLLKEKNTGYEARILYSDKQDYAIYEIGPPELWHHVHAQMFEKLSTPEGKTVWNDLTKGELASVGSQSSEWTGQDLNVRYRSNMWTPREEFTLPSTSRLCVLVPLNGEHFERYPGSNEQFNSHYIVVPEEDIIGLNEDEVNQCENNSDLETSDNSSEITEKDHRRVMVRISRDVLKGNADKLNIVSHGAKKYLTLPHRRPLRAQIDLEARADENELVRVGASGRISIAVTDATRKKRTIFNLQVGNTGLAAARFRVEARDCYPLFESVKNKDVPTSDPVLIPPRHTRSVRLELPDEILADLSHCSVALINDEGQSVAIRDVAVKKGDRCFCVWHCDCVCLSVDPKLICLDMDGARQKAAGLVPREGPRRTRSLEYTNSGPIDFLGVFVGVLFFLLLFGAVKAVLGLLFSYTGTWGLYKLLTAPRHLDHYYESKLRGREVEYDPDGWPIHPDTKKKTVHVVSRPMEFILNLILFVCLPGVMIYDLCKSCCPSQSAKTEKVNSASNLSYASNNRNKPSTSTKSAKEIFSTNDLQDELPRWRRRRNQLHSWMTPQARELSADLWKESLKVHPSDSTEFVQPPVLGGRSFTVQLSRTAESAQDSEQDDTEYVLSQMQKSRESLARSQIKMNNLDSSSYIALTNTERN